MGIVGRIIGAAIFATVSYMIYVYLPPFLLTFVSGDGFEFGDFAKITVGSFTSLVAYITGLGYIIVGTSFAAGVSPKNTWIKALWSILQFMLSICFWGIFLYLGFNTINVKATFMTGGLLSLDLDITVMFWVMMGANIFALVIAVIDLIISFLPKEETVSKAKKEKLPKEIKEKKKKGEEDEPKLEISDTRPATRTMEVIDPESNRPTAPKGPKPSEENMDDFFNKSPEDLK